jgi:hypothetical protein
MIAAFLQAQKPLVEARSLSLSKELSGDVFRQDGYFDRRLLPVVPSTGSGTDLMPLHTLSITSRKLIANYSIHLSNPVAELIEASC